MSSVASTRSAARVGRISANGLPCTIITTLPSASIARSGRSVLSVCVIGMYVFSSISCSTSLDEKI